jgi:hypothetical protein
LNWYFSADTNASDASEKGGFQSKATYDVTAWSLLLFALEAYAAKMQQRIDFGLNSTGIPSGFS